MSLFRKKPVEAPKKVKVQEEPKTSPEKKGLPRIITAEGWHRKVLGKPTEIVLKKRS